MFGNQDWHMCLHRTFSVHTRTAIIAEGAIARAAVHGRLVFTHAVDATWDALASTTRQQLQGDHVIQQFGSGFGGWAAAGWACEHTLRHTPLLHLDCTPTAGLVEASVKLQQWGENQQGK
jgi:hypothetical protein